MNGKVGLVTGATDGIGKEAALALARRGARVLVHGRDSEKGRAVVEAIARATGNGDVDYLHADFASLGQVRELAEHVERRTGRLDVLVNNAGLFSRRRLLTEDGFELTFQVNYLAHFLLTVRLLDLLRQSAPSRIVIVSSMTHEGAALPLDDLRAERGYNGHRAYAASKLAELLITRELARRLEGTGVTANALHPGGVRTKLLREGWGAVGSFGVSPARAARTVVYLASSPEVQGVTGGYFVHERRREPSREARDPELARELWNVSERLAGIAARPSGHPQP